MSVIIRLQNLPWSANALDIRQFFTGLSIPEGGVHIVGGELGDAFIAFSTDEDARQAFNLNGGKLKEIQIKLMLSSRTEMQKVIEAARTPSLTAFMQATPAATTQPLPSLVPQIVSASALEFKKGEFGNDKRIRRRSRSRSHERKDRSRDRDRRDRRRRDRSRSRSRDRRDRRRRDRSHSREKRSKERDHRSKDRRHSEDQTGSSSNSSLNNLQSQQNKIGVWEDPVRNEPAPVLQAQALLNTLIPSNLEDTRRNINPLASNSLPLNNRNGFPKQNDLFYNNRSNDSWSSGSNFVTQNDSLPNMNSRFDRNLHGGNGNDNRINRPNPRSLINNPSVPDNSRLVYNNKQGKSDGRPNNFDSGSHKPGMLGRPQVLDRSVPAKRSSNDFIKNCCVQLQPFFGGYGEIRRFFHSFIQNTGIKFINDDTGRRTGIVYIRFATKDGKDQALLKDSMRLKHKNVEIREIDDETFDKTVDRYNPSIPHNNESNQYSPERSYKNKSNPVTFSKTPTHYSCLAVEDLPLFTKEQDMLKIFSDYPLLSILLVNKQRHVIAYIKFNNPDDSKKALSEKSMQIFDGKPLNLRPCSDEEFAYISADEHEPEVIEVEDDEKTYVTSECISLSGLPLKTTDRDISDFFSDVAIVPNKIHLISSHLGFTGQAYCEFSSRDDAEVALEKNDLPLGSGTITVKSIPRTEMEAIIGATSRTNLNIMNPSTNQNQVRPYFPRNFVRGGGVGGGHGPSLAPRALMGHRPPLRRFLPPFMPQSEMAPPGCTLLMENVPYKAGLNEILEFFDGFEISSDNVLRRYNENGTPSGEAKVIFNCTDDAYQALQNCNHGKIRERTIYLSQC